MKPTAIIDFDGVLHSYTSGWQGACNIPDPPTPGAKEAVVQLRERYWIVVVSSRCHQPGGMAAIQEWLRRHSIEVDDVTAFKPPHVVTVDDRALRFNGDWSEVLTNIEQASIPWNKQDNQP